MSRLCIAVTAVLVCCAASQLMSGKMFGAAMSEGKEIRPGEKLFSDGTCVDRADMITRAQDWTNRSIPYCQCNSDCCGTCPYCSTYRCDCSGFVSMVWNVGRGYTTSTLTEIGNYITVDDLVTGDALVCSGAAGGHVVLFDSWIKKGTTYHCYQEPGCSASPPHAYWGICDATWVWSECGTFKPIRFKNACPPGPPPPPAPPAVPSPPSNCTTFHAGLCPGSSDCQCSLGDGCGNLDMSMADMIEQRAAAMNAKRPYTCSSLGGSCYNVVHGKCPGPSTCLAQGDAC